MSVTKIDYKGETRYRVTYRDKDGKQYKRVFHRKRDADAFEADEKSKANRGEATIARRGGPTFGELLDEWHGELATIGKPPSASQMERFNLAIAHRVSDDLRRARITDIDVKMLKSVVAEWSRAGVTDESKRGALSLIRKVFEFAQEERDLPVRFPEAKSLRITVRSKKRPHAYSDDDLRAIERRMARKKDAALMYLMANTGLRIGEAFGLRIEDVDGNRLHVRRQLNSKTRELIAPKGGKERTISLSTAARANLDILIGKRQHGFVYPSQGDDEKPAMPNLWRARRWRPAAEAAGFPKPVPHDLRHSYASHAIAAGANVLELQRQMGHARASITLDTYSHEFDSNGSLFLDKLNERTAGLVPS